VDVTSLLLGASVNNYPLTGVNVYGVPWIIGAKKASQTLTSSRCKNVVEVERKLQVTRQPVAGPLHQPDVYFQCQQFTRCRIWNSYNSNYVSAAGITSMFWCGIHLNGVISDNDGTGFSW